jgi:hypothetical protein
MQIIGCDLLDTETEELVNRTLLHEAGEVREFYSQLPRPALVGIEAIGPMQWFLSLLEELGIECQVGDAAKIRAAEPRKMRYSDCLGEWIATRSWPVALRRASEDCVFAVAAARLLSAERVADFVPEDGRGS